MRWVINLCVFSCAAVCGCNAASTTPSRTDIGKVALANTAVNKRDRAEIAKSPFDHSNAQPDLEKNGADTTTHRWFTRLFLNARNVKVITDSGKVTLRGPVKNEGEQLAMEKIAHDVAGGENVVNQIDVAESE